MERPGRPGAIRINVTSITEPPGPPAYAQPFRRRVMGHWILELGMLFLEAYCWRKERTRQPIEGSEKPLPKIVGSVPHVPPGK